MTLAIVFKGPEGLVLAADSRISFSNEACKEDGEKVLIHSTFDSAVKLFTIKGQDHIGIVTYGAGSLDPAKFRPASSFISEFEKGLYKSMSLQRFKTKEFAEKLGIFFQEKWKEIRGSTENPCVSMNFIIAGFDENEVYGRIFKVSIPSNPKPTESYPESTKFGIEYGGQQEIVDRIIKGYDPELFNSPLLEPILSNPTSKHLLICTFNAMSMKIPYEFLPNKDAVNLLRYLIQCTIQFQSWQLGTPMVGGDINIATITQTEGLFYHKNNHLSSNLQDRK